VTPITGGGTGGGGGGAVGARPQSSVISTSTPVRVRPEPSALTRKSSSCKGPAASLEMASFWPSGDQLISQTSLRLGTSVVKPLPSGAIVLTAFRDAYAILLPSGDQDGCSARGTTEGAAVRFWRLEPSALTT